MSAPVGGSPEVNKLQVSSDGHQMPLAGDGPRRPGWGALQYGPMFIECGLGLTGVGSRTVRSKCIMSNGHIGPSPCE